MRFGSIEVELADGIKRQAIVVRMFNNPPMILLTNRMKNERNDLWELIIAYMQRWNASEEGIRGIKQIYNFEAIRVLRWNSLRRLTLLAFLAYGFLCLVKSKIADLPHFLSGYKSFGNIPNFPYYRVAHAISCILFMDDG